MVNLYLIRHGENTANITKELSYKLVDYDLTEKGRLQSEQTADVFKETHIDKIFSSPLKRAVQTADYIARRKGMKNTVEEDFREINVGDLEKREPNVETWNAYFDVVSEWYSGNMKAAFPDGESGNELVARFVRGIERAIGSDCDSTIVVVGHGGIFTVGVMEICRVDDRESFGRRVNDNCSISVVRARVSDRMEYELVSWADSTHLSGPAAHVVNGLPELNGKRK